MESRLARILSYLFHPLLMATYGYAILMFQGDFILFYYPLKTSLALIGFVFLISAVLPVLVNYVFLRTGIIKSIELFQRQERLWPFLVTAACLYLTAYMVNQLQLPGVFYLFGLGASMLVLMALFLTFYVKISAHMMGIGGLTGTFLALSIRAELRLLLLILVLFLVSGLVAFARLRLKAHKPFEVYLGYLVGFGVMFLLFYLI